MVSTQQERAVVAELYGSESWKKKVDNMPDHQVHAIYMKYQAIWMKNKNEENKK